MTSRYLTISEAAAAMRAGDTTGVELVEHAIGVSDVLEEVVGSFVSRFSEQARERAHAVDVAIAAGAPIGVLAGIPLGIKDILTTSEGPTTAQSCVLDPGWSDGDAVAVARLRNADAIVLGKTTTMEFAIGMPDPFRPFPTPTNPWDVNRWAGGSSSGSASAVATGAALGAIGTDTAGSIRIPAAFCGISGLMPTFGRVPKSGCVPLGYTLDHVGPMARSARDCAILLSVLAGYDPSDVTAIDAPVPDYIGGLTGDLTGVRIGVDRLTAAAGDAADPALPGVLDAAIAVLESRGAIPVDVELPLYAELSTAATVIMLSEALAYHLPDLQDRWLDYCAGTRGMLGFGLFYSGGDYVQAQRVRRVGQRAIAALFANVNLILTPTSSAGAPSHAEVQAVVEGGDVGRFRGIHTQYWDILGNPVLAVPAGFTADGLPLGVQIAGRPFDEALVLRAGDAYQQSTTWHLHVPPIAALQEI